MILVVYQPYFLPNRTYFDLINKADIFVYYDNVQYTKDSWQNRNKIKTPQGTEWITIPVYSKGKFLQEIKDVEICYKRAWNKKMLKKLQVNYARAPHFAKYQDYFRKILSKEWKNLCDLDIKLTEDICRFLKIDHVQFLRASELAMPKLEKSHKLLWLCKKLKIKTYISGSGARNYLNEKLFEENNIKVKWHETNPNNYPVYKQINGKYQSALSVVDLLFNCGNDSNKYLKSVDVS